MARRNSNHIIGDIAVREISASLIPPEWIINTQTSDYGLDLLVEIAKDDKTTGKMFFIQAKGTDTPSNNGTIHFPFSVERLRDYKSVSLPVLLVVFSCQEKLFWGKWVNSLYDLLSPEQQEQVSYSIILTQDNIIDQEYLLTIEENYSNSLPKGLCIQSTCSNRIISRIHNQLLKKAEELFNSDISDNNRLSCLNIHIEYSYEKGALSAIIHDDFGHQSRFSGPLGDESILYYNTLSDSDCPPVFWDILLSIAYLQRSFSRIESFHIISEHITPRFFSSLSDSDWLSFISNAPKENLCKLDRYLGLCVKQERAELLSLSLISIFVASNGDYNLTRPYLLQVYNNESDPENKGLLAYNIANSLHNSDLDTMYEAASWYFTAIQSFPAYRKLEYWWQEMGSVLYNTGHYSYAEHFYKKARSISKERCNPDIRVFIADCLVKQLKLAEAKREICSFIDEKKQNGEDIKSSVVLKAKALVFFEKKLPTITFDPLLGLEWFNQGVHMSHQANYNDALMCFLIAWLLNDADMESLLNVLISSWNINNTAITCEAFWAMKELYGEDGYNMIVSTILKQDIPVDVRDRFLDGLNDLLSNYEVHQCKSHRLAASYDGWESLEDQE